MWCGPSASWPLQDALPVMGRMLALAGGDEELAHLVLPLIRDTLASQTSGADAEVGRRLRGRAWG